MYFFTHLMISKLLYQHLSNETDLNKRAFAYGNIKPDLPSPLRNHHTLENCLFTTCEYSSQLMSEPLPSAHFSTRMGEICHYICDFFCYYHLNEEIHNKNLHHLFYEISLHHELLRLLLKNKIKVVPSFQEPRKGINSIILEMRKAYYSKPPCKKRDIDYAIQTSVWACESIIHYLKYSSIPLNEAELETYSLLTLEGGIL